MHLLTRGLIEESNIKLEQKIKIAIIGDFEPERLSHKATNEALLHAAESLSLMVISDWLPAKSLEESFMSREWKSVINY